MSKSLKEAIVHFVSRREHSAHELREKLKRHSDCEEQIDLEIQSALQNDIINHARFAQAIARQRCRQGYGPLRVSAELSSHKIGRDCVQSAIDACDWQKAAAVALRKCKHQPQKPGWYRYMYTRGFRQCDVDDLFIHNSMQD